MRENLFRGKDWIGNWHIGSLVHKMIENDTMTNYYASSGMCNHVIKPGDYYIIDKNGEGFWVSPDSIGQYIGFNDEHDIQIFEGDIVSFKRENVLGYTTHRIGDVRYGDRLPVFYIMATTGDAWDWVVCQDITIIGNIYDNPELLKRE